MTPRENPKNLQRILVLIFALIQGLSCQAELITWGNAVDDVLFQSDGSIPLDSNFVASLGFFDSFIPTPNNIHGWESNWKTFDNTTTALGGFNHTSGYYTGSATITAGQLSDSPDANPTQTFPVTTQPYVWVYNSLTIATTSEWALYTNPAWEFPDGSDTHSPPLDWRLSDATTAVVGGINNGSSIGDGPLLTHTAPSSSYSLQTFAVPEPSSIGLVLVALTGIFWNGRRRSGLTK